MTEKTKPKISLGMIVKDEEEILEKTLEAVKLIVDEFCIVDTGSTDKTHDIIKKYQENIITIPFEDFVITKNKALEHCHGDYVLWMDADEILYKGHSKLLEWASKGVDAVNCKITEGPADDYTIIDTMYDRIRMWKNNGKWKFHGPGVHEVIVGDVYPIDDPTILVRHEHLKSTKAVTAKERFTKYIQILTKYLAIHPNDTRAWFYLGRTYMDVNERLMAISAFIKYLTIQPNWFKDEKFDAAFNIAKCYREEGEYEKAKSWAETALQMDDRRSEAYCLLGDLVFNKKDWKEAAFFYEKALRPLPEDVILFLEPYYYKKYPKDQLVLCYYNIKEFKKAENLAESLRQNLLPDIDQRILNNLWWCRKFTHMKIFMCLGLTPEPLYGGMIKEAGVHGVETTYIELSAEFYKLGHEVFLFCTTDKEHVSEGVHYIPYEKINEYLSIEPDVIIASRWYDSFYFETKAKKVLWLQDAYYADPQGRKVFTDCHLYICSSPWHRDYTYQRFGHDINSTKFFIIPLGIRTELFQPPQNRDKNKAIYSSNPDRGLYILIEMWDKIKEQLPDLTLTIYYGWDGLKTWNQSEEWQNSVKAQKERVMNWISTHPEITLAGRVPKQVLAKEFLSASMCLYPNNFFETFCITALETQAAGVPMITTDMGALSTTLNKAFNILIPGSPYSQLYQEKFVMETVQLYNNNVVWKSFSEGNQLWIQKMNFDWPSIARIWQEHLWRLF